MVELKCETDFVAGAASSSSRKPTQPPSSWLPKASTPRRPARANLDDLKITLKENIELGRVVRLEANEGETLDSYLHVQEVGRGVNGVLVVVAGG